MRPAVDNVRDVAALVVEALDGFDNRSTNTLACDAVVEQRDAPAREAYGSNPDRTWWLRPSGR